MSTASYVPCLICVEMEVAKLLSLSIDLGFEPETREDVLNLIRMSDYSSTNADPNLIQDVVDAFLAAM